MTATLTSANSYPDTTCAALATHLQVEPEQIVVGPGSSPLLKRLFAAARTGPGDEVLVPAPGFQAFPLLAAQADIALRGVGLSPGWEVDLDAMADAVDPGSTRLILVSNPHNPTGTLCTR
jgi:histidinol-phosphate aminotransferase